jgi:hypothetical protein
VTYAATGRQTAGIAGWICWAGDTKLPETRD